MKSRGTVIFLRIVIAMFLCAFYACTTPDSAWYNHLDLTPAEQVYLEDVVVGEYYEIANNKNVDYDVVLTVCVEDVRTNLAEGKSYPIYSQREYAVDCGIVKAQESIFVYLDFTEAIGIAGYQWNGTEFDGFRITAVKLEYKKA